MCLNQILTFLLVIFGFTSGFSQEVSISKDLPESDYQIIGTWNSKIISCKRFFERELTIVDTTSNQMTKQVIKVSPKIEKAKKIGSIYYFIHNQFLYEIYFVFDKYSEIGPSGYNVIVKRDLETMEIITQKSLEGLYGQMKFVKTCDEGFFLCLGDSYTLQYNRKIFIYESPQTEIIPKKIYSFDYSLEKLWSLDLKDNPGQSDLYLNDISLDEDSYLLIPNFEAAFVDGEGNITRPKIVFTVADLKGEVAKINLEIKDLDDYIVNSVKIKYDPLNKRIHGVLMVSKPIEGNLYFMREWGGLYAYWREDGSLIKSNLVLLDKNNVFGTNIDEYAKRVSLNLNTVSTFNLDSNVGYFDILENGDALYVANNICLRVEEKLVHSKFILSISKEGKLNWSLTLPYNGNQLYENVHYVVHDNCLYMYTREFRQNFESGTYIFKDTRQGLTGKSLLMSVRIIDLKTGDLISHKPLIEDTYLSKFVPFFRIYDGDPDELIIRYRSTSKNLEKLVRIKYE